MAKIFNFHLGLTEVTSPTARINTGYIYTKDSSGNTELFYYDNSGNETQITNAGVLTLGTSIINGTSSVSIPVADQGVVVTTAGTQRAEIDLSGNFDFDATAYNLTALGNLEITGSGATGYVVITSDTKDITLTTGTGDGNIYVTALGSTSGNVYIQSKTNVEIDTTTAIIDGSTDVFIKNNGTTRMEIDSEGVKVTNTFSVSDADISTFERTTAVTTGNINALNIKVKTTADMVDGFGSGISFSIEDSASVSNNIAYISAIRNGVDNTGKLDFATYTSGVATTRLSIQGGNTYVTGSLYVEETVWSSINRTVTSTNVAYASLIINTTSTGSMLDGFGTGVIFALYDSAGTRNYSGSLLFKREGADTSSAMYLSTYDSTVGSTRLYISHDGKLATGDETAPDVDPGGLCLYQESAGFYKTLNMKDNAIAHGMTGLIETDTYTSFGKVNTTTGGLRIESFTESYLGMYLKSNVTTVITTNTTASYGAITFVGAKKGTTNVGIMGDNDNVIAWRNYTTTRMILKGDGELYNDYSTAMTTFDDFDDLTLARNTQLALSSIERAKLKEQTVTQLRDLGIINEHGFGSMQQINAVSLGAITQLGNAVKVMAKELGWSKTKLMEALKTY